MSKPTRKGRNGGKTKAWRVGAAILNKVRVAGRELPASRFIKDTATVIGAAFRAKDFQFIAAVLAVSNNVPSDIIEQGA